MKILNKKALEDLKGQINNMIMINKNICLPKSRAYFIMNGYKLQADCEMGLVKELTQVIQ